MNILISSAGRRVSLVRAFQKELKKLFPDGKVFAADADPVLSGACQIADGYFKVPYLSDPSYFEVLIRECQVRDIKLLIPTIDTELLMLAENRKQLEENGITPVIASKEFVSKCRDKREIHKFFESHGVSVAKEFSKKSTNFPCLSNLLTGVEASIPT